MFLHLSFSADTPIYWGIERGVLFLHVENTPMKQIPRSVVDVDEERNRSTRSDPLTAALLHRELLIHSMCREHRGHNRHRARGPRSSSWTAADRAGAGSVDAGIEQVPGGDRRVLEGRTRAAS